MNILDWCALYRMECGDYSAEKFEEFIRKYKTLGVNRDYAYCVRRTLALRVDLE